MRIYWGAYVQNIDQNTDQACGHGCRRPDTSLTCENPTFFYFRHPAPHDQQYLTCNLHPTV